MKKTLIAVIILVLLAGVGASYAVYKETHQASNNKIDIVKPIDVKKENLANIDNSVDQSKKATSKEVEIQGKVTGIGEKNIYIGKEGVSPETLNINSRTPVFEKDGTTNSGLWAITSGKTAKVKYDESTKNVTAIILLEK